MPSINTLFTPLQVKRLNHSVSHQIQIPKDVRKKIYYWSKQYITVGQGLCEVITEIIRDETGKDIDMSLLNKMLPEFNKSSYNSIISNKFIDVLDCYWDTLDVVGYRNRIVFLNHLIDKL